MNCPVREKTADGAPVGRCWFYMRDGVCPRHGAPDEDETMDVPPMSDAQLLATYRLLGDMQRVMDVLTINDDEEETDGTRD